MIGELERTTLASAYIDRQAKTLVLNINLQNYEVNKADGIIAKIKEKQGDTSKLKVGFAWHREKRSPNANAYFHLLVDRIADVLGIGREQTKIMMVLDYGTPMRDETGEKVGFKLPSTVNVNNLYKYAKFFGTRYENGKLFNCYLVYKETHTLNSEEMARLIDGTVQEAKQLDIETRTPQELAALCRAWEPAS